jgi:hypothetical protein
MANEAQVGKAVVFGLDGSITYTGIGTLELQSGSLEHRFELYENKNKEGEVQGAVAFNPTLEFTLDFLPVSAGTGAGALASAKTGLKLPTPLAKVTLSGFAHADLNTDYVYVGGGKIAFDQANPAKMSLPIRRYRTDISTPAS